MRQWIDRIFKGLWLSALILTTSVLSVVAYRVYESAQSPASFHVPAPYRVIDVSQTHMVFVYLPLDTSADNDTELMYRLFGELNSMGEPYVLMSCVEDAQAIAMGADMRCIGLLAGGH